MSYLGAESLLADLYCAPEPPRRPSWVCEPAWYWYQLGDARAVSRDREVRWGMSPETHWQLRLLRSAWWDEGEALGRLWAKLLGDLA